jgi:hypothetical protein
MFFEAPNSIPSQHTITTYTHTIPSHNTSHPIYPIPILHSSVSHTLTYARIPFCYALLQQSFSLV